MRSLLSLAVLTFCLAVAPAPAQTHGRSSQEVDTETNEAGQLHAPSADDIHAGNQAHGPEYELLTIDGLTAVWTIIVFVIVLIALRAAAWKPIQKVLADREKYISDSLEQAKHERQEAQALLDKYTEQIHAAREEASAIVKEGRRDAEEVKRKIEEDARVEGAAMIERARREIGLATDTAIKELYSVTARLSTDVAARIIRKELDPKEHQRLIAESIEELQAMDRDRQGKN